MTIAVFIRPEANPREALLFVSFFIKKKVDEGQFKSIKIRPSIGACRSVHLYIRHAYSIDKATDQKKRPLTDPLGGGY
jgi:hypothetical protein